MATSCSFGARALGLSPEEAVNVGRTGGAGHKREGSGHDFISQDSGIGVAASRAGEDAKANPNRIWTSDFPEEGTPAR
jgi:hypothetical protein